MKRTALIVTALAALFALTTAYSPGGVGYVEYFGQWGSYGTGPGQFNRPSGLACTDNGRRIYVADTYNHRIQYFDWTEPAVAPASLGRVKALFR